VSKGQRKT